MSDLDTDSSDDEDLDSADGDLLDVAAVASPAIQRRQQAARQQAESKLQDRRVQAFLGALRQGESGNGANPDGRYNVIFGGRTFNNYSRHPNIRVPVPNSADHSTAAGAYQMQFGTWNQSAQRLGLQDFTPHSQDLAAVDQLEQAEAIDPLLKGDGKDDLDQAVYSAAKKWDSLPAGSNGISKFGNPRPNALQTFTDRYNMRLHGP